MGTIQSDLFDLGPYPAAAPGDRWLLGEIWEFKSEDMAPTLLKLDQIEGYCPGSEDNEYVRQTVTAEFVAKDGSAGQVRAFAYFAAQPKRLATARQILPFVEFLGRPVAAWPDSISRVPSSFSEE